MIITKRSFVWHDMNIKYIWHEYQSTTKIIIITTRLLVWLASSFFCCWLALQAPGFGLAGGLGFRFFHQQFFPYASLRKKDPVHFEIQVWIVSGTGETSTLMSSWWRAGIFIATTIFNKCRQIWSCCPQLRQRVLSSWQHGAPDSSQGDLDTFAGLPSCHLIIMKTSHEDHIIIWSSGKGYKSKIILSRCFCPSSFERGRN